MPIFSWQIRRQLAYFGVFALIVIAIVGGGIWFFWPDQTCLDNRQNQNEEGVDCGGVCEKKCLGHVEDVRAIWTRFFEIESGFYDVTALVDNPNTLAGAKEIVYRFKLHDKNNILIAIREGRTFINPQERFVIFETRIRTLERIPIRASIEIDPISWERMEIFKPDISFFGYNLVREPFGRMDATIRNNDIFEAENLEVIVVLLDKSENAIAVSRTIVESLADESEKRIGFTWPFAIPVEPASIKIYIRKIP